MEILILSFSFAVSVFTRLFDVGRFHTLTAEVGQHYMQIVKLLEGQLFVHGPLTSHPWLTLSATPYYLFFPFFALFKFHPLTLFYLTVAANILLPIINYYVVKKTLSRETAVISTILLAFSPLLLTFGRVPGFYSFVPVLTYWLMYAVYGIVTGKTKKLWPVFLVIGLMSTMHAASLMLLPFFAGLFFVLKKIDRKQILKSLLAFLIANLPFLFNDLASGFSMTKSLILWIPYKVLNFLTGKTLGFGRQAAVDRTIEELLAFIRAGFFPSQSHFIIGALVLSAIAGYFLLKKRSVFEKVLFYWLLWGLLVLMVHKNPPLHYFVPILTLPVILVSRILTDLMKKKIGVVAAVSIIIMLIFINTKFIFSKDHLYNDPASSSEFVSLNDQENIVKLLVNDVGGKKYSLTRIGPFDHYINQFKENYEFLLWRQKSRPVEKSDIKYYIVEGASEKTNPLKKVGQSGKISLYKNQ